MDDRTALLHSVIATPDDDLPRLVFADWLKEHDDAGYAAFIRAQIELANTPPWEPFAVHCRHFASDAIVRGTPWLTHLPQLRPGLEWHPETAFRRGFAWSLIVREMPVFMLEAARLFAEAPIGQLYLPTATLDQWEWFADQPWLPRVKSIHFYGLTLAVEPVSVLCRSARAMGLEEVVFEVSRGVAMPILVERLFRSRWGRRLRSIEFRGIDQAQDELIEAFTQGSESPRLSRLAFVNCRFAPEHVEQLADSPVLDTLTALDVVNTYLTDAGDELMGSPRLAQLASLNLTASGVRRIGLAKLADSPHLPSLRMLNLSQYRALGPALRLTLPGLPGRLRSLNLSETDLTSDSLSGLVDEWMGVSELVLSGNHELSMSGVKVLLNAEMPPELTALDYRRNLSNKRLIKTLRRHFGSRILV